MVQLLNDHVKLPLTGGLYFYQLSTLVNLNNTTVDADNFTQADNIISCLETACTPLSIGAVAGSSPYTLNFVLNTNVAASVLQNAIRNFDVNATVSATTF